MPRPLPGRILPSIVLRLSVNESLRHAAGGPADINMIQPALDCQTLIPRACTSYLETIKDLLIWPSAIVSWLFQLF